MADYSLPAVSIIHGRVRRVFVCENRLVYFDPERIDTAPEEPIEQRTANGPQGQSLDVLNHQAQCRSRRVAEHQIQEAKETDRLDDEIEKKLDQVERPGELDKERTATREKWVEEIAKELNIHSAAIRLTEPDQKLRAPVEQYAIRVNGAIAGHVYAGFENGKSVRDEAKYIRSHDETHFTEKGFKLQLRSLERHIRKLVAGSGT